jgi:hypothetical protein
MSDIQALANQYVTLCAAIKQDAAAVAEKRKHLKSLDAMLLVEMARAGVDEVTSNGVVIARANRLLVK